jgi:hypothetical protein
MRIEFSGTKGACKASDDPPLNGQKQNNGSSACMFKHSKALRTHTNRGCSLWRMARVVCVCAASKAVTSQPIKANTSCGCIFSRVEIVFCQTVLCDTFPFPLLRRRYKCVCVKFITIIHTRAHRQTYLQPFNTARAALWTNVGENVAVQRGRKPN